MTNKQIIDRFIYDYFCAHARDPEFWEIEEQTGICASALSRNLPGYDENLRITLTEKRVMDLYGKMKDREIAEKLDILPSAVGGIIYRLRKKGKLNAPRIQLRSEDKRTYITVKEAFAETRTNTKIKIVDVSCCGGYIDKVIKGISKCIVYKDGKAYKVDLTEKQYKVVGM